MKKGFASIIILLGIALIILIAGVMIYQKVLAPKAQPTPVPAISLSPILTPTTINTPSVPQPSPATDLTADWKTYTNTKQEYQLKYPNGWELIEARVNSGNESDWSEKFLERDELQKVTFVNRKAIQYEGYFQIAVLPNPKQLSLLDWIKSNRPNDDPSKEKDILLAGMPAVERVMPSLVYPPDIEITVIKNDQIYQITLAMASIEHSLDIEQSELVEQRQTYDQILSTFRFD